MSATLRVLPLVLLGAALPAPLAFADAEQTWVEIISPGDGNGYKLGTHLDFEVEGEVINERRHGQDYFLVVRILDVDHNLVDHEIIHLGELDHGEVLPYDRFESVDTEELGLGTWHFTAAVGPHWKLAPDDYDSHEVPIVRNWEPIQARAKVE